MPSNELTYKELLKAYGKAEQDVKFWQSHGRYGDGKDIAAKAERDRLFKELLKLKAGN